jgi:hypothetical protein
MRGFGVLRQAQDDKLFIADCAGGLDAGGADGRDGGGAENGEKHENDDAGACERIEW